MKKNLKIKATVACILTAAMLLGGCSKKMDSMTASANEAVSYKETAPQVEYYDEYADAADGYAGEYLYDVAMEQGAAVTDVTFAQNKKIIYSSSVVMETMVYNETYSRLLELINKYDGYIESENFNNQLRSYLKDNSGKGKLVISTNNMTIRVPSKNYTSFMTEGLSLGNVLSRNQNITDKTNEYNTNMSYVEILREEAEYLDKQLQQLSEELKNAVASEIHYDDIIFNMKDVASRKAQVEKELVPYQRVVDDIDEKVEFSTVTMELREVNEYTIIEEEIEEESFGSQIEKSWNDAMDGLGNMFKSIFLFLIDIIPVLVGLLIFGVIALIICKIIKRRIKKSKSKKAASTVPQTSLFPMDAYPQNMNMPAQPTNTNDIPVMNPEGTDGTEQGQK